MKYTHAHMHTATHALTQVGWLADKVDRRMLLFIVVVVGEAPCLATVRRACVCMWVGEGVEGGRRSRGVANSSVGGEGHGLGAACHRTSATH